MQQKYFTIEEANSSLVLVKPIVRDIILKRKKMIAMKRSLKELSEQNKSEYKKPLDLLANELKKVSEDITYHLEELEDVGCYLKNFELGIINFPAILDGKVVFLCWMFGEKSVENWHELTVGFEKRKPITEQFTTLTVTPLKRDLQR